MKRWTRWQDWVAGLAGLYAALATLWTRQGGASTVLMVVLGLLLVVSAIVNLAAPGRPVVEWAQVVIGALLFLAPWYGLYATLTGAAWTSWITGVIAGVVTATAIRPSVETHRHHTPRLSH